MVHGETYECVKGFCYLGDTLDGDCGADLAATARIRKGDEDWVKKCMEYRVEGRRLVERPRKTWL